MQKEVMGELVALVFVAADVIDMVEQTNASKGDHGASKNMIGTRGEDKVVRVPVGTVIHLFKGELPSKVVKCSKEDLDPWDLPGSLDVEQAKPDLESVPEALNKVDGALFLQCSVNSSADKEISGEKSTSTDATKPKLQDEEHVYYNVAELTEPGQQIIIAQGGDGSLGNVHSSNVSKKAKLNKMGLNSANASCAETESENQSPHSAGAPGSEAVLILELKSIADAGLVGMPNAGKSTLLGSLSRAKPRVGHCAFTTPRPNLGKLSFSDFSITVADIPGLIKGAHEDHGLGHAFLRHIERTKVLAYVLDLAAALDGRKGLPPWVQLKDLVLELEHHQQGLSDRPSLIVANKIDETRAEKVCDELRRRYKVFPFTLCAQFWKKGYQS